jgi:hypothetical protein
MIWTALACLTLFINSIVWSGNMIDWSPTGVISVRLPAKSSLGSTNLFEERRTL